MTDYKTTIVARRGYMQDGEHVSTVVEAHAEDPETGLIGAGLADNDEEAIRLAIVSVQEIKAARERSAAEAAQRAKEDPMVRLAQLEAFARERGFDG